MAQLKAILTDDNGNELSYHEYLVGEEMKNLSRIERAVEKLRPQILSGITVTISINMLVISIFYVKFCVIFAE